MCKDISFMLSRVTRQISEHFLASRNSFSSSPKPQNWSVISRLNIYSALKVKSLCIDMADE